MNGADGSTTLPAGMVERVLRQLGITGIPEADLDGLRTVYRAWCQRVPFDNVRKMIALRTGSDPPLPGTFAAEFLDSWLRHGTGGTCWPSSNALFELLCSLGFDARRVAGSMRDLGVENHGSIIVGTGERQWLVDSSILCNLPLPLAEENFATQDPAFGVEVEPDGETHVVWLRIPPNPGFMPCRVYPASVTHSFYAARYEASRQRSPFNQRVYARRNQADGMIILVGNTRFHSTRDGLDSRGLTPDQLCESLHAEIGLSKEMIEEWSRAGGLAASMEAGEGPPPPPVVGVPPSQRSSGI